MATELTPQSCPAYILCGGQSSRFHSDKALASVDGMPQLLRLGQLLRTQGHAIQFVADRADRYRGHLIDALIDAEPNCGPMAGLVTATQHRQSNFGAGWFLLLSCDQLIWKSSHFQSLAALASEKSVAITFRQQMLQPIPGLYHTCIHDIARQSIQNRQLSLKKLLDLHHDRVNSIAAADNPRDWCFNDRPELENLIQKLADIN